jgi:DNA-binding NtrC family response regulator
LASCVLKIPPLRERLREVAPLARAFISQACAELDRPELELAREALVVLERYAWPGNIRELKNAMQRAAALSRGSQILPEHLPERLRRMPATSIAPASEALPAADDDELSRLRGQISELSRLRIVDALERCSGNQTRAARELGISRRTLVNRLQAYSLPRPRRS